MTARRDRTAINFVVLALVLGAAGVALVGLALRQRSQDAGFSARAVEVQARILSATETRVRRNPPYTKAQISFTTPGSGGPTFAEITDCPEARVAPEADVVQVLYDPADESDVRVPGCVDKNFKLYLALGGLLLVVDVVFIASIASGRRRARDMNRLAQTADPGRTEPIVIKQKRSSVIVIYGFVAVASAAALVRGHTGAETESGRIVVDVIFGLLTLGSIALLVSLLRSPGSIAVARDTITHTHRGAPNSVVLRRTGDLYVGGTMIGTTGGRTRYLKVVGSDDAIPLEVFDYAELQRACVAMGWRFAESSVH